MSIKVARRAEQCHEDFLAMVASIDETANSLKKRFLFHVALKNGKSPLLLETNALHDKFREHLKRAQDRWLMRHSPTGRNYVDYPSYLRSLSAVARQDAENRTTISAWNTAKGPFLEALCLLADLLRSTSKGPAVPVQLFKPFGPLEVMIDGRSRFIWVQPIIKAPKSLLNACPDIVITDQPRLRHTTIVAIHECKCHRNLQSDEIRKECGKATDLLVGSYVIVSYYTQRMNKSRGAEALGLKIRGLGLDTPEREQYVEGRKNLASDLSDDWQKMTRKAASGRGWKKMESWRRREAEATINLIYLGVNSTIAFVPSSQASHASQTERSVSSWQVIKSDP